MASSAFGSDLLSDEQLEQLGACRQGDVIALDRQVWLAHGDLPTTTYAKEHAAPGKLSGMYEKAAAGLAVLTQTCDLIPRPDRNRPFVAVAPLVELEGQDALEARRGRRPRYAHLPSYEDGRFYVDLDRITTIETGLLLRYARTPGLSTDRDRATFGKAVARKFGRFPFPDDLPRALAKWRDHVVSKHDKENSPEGTLYRHALDVRVSVLGAWDADAINVTVSVLFPPGFLPPPDPDTDPEVGSVEAITSLPAARIAQMLCDGVAHPQTGALMCERLEQLWADRCAPTGTVRSIEFELLGVDDMTVDAYLNSYSFDLEFLSPVGESDQA